MFSICSSLIVTIAIKIVDLPMAYSKWYR